MWQNKFDNSKIRDYNRDNREETRKFFCPYVLVSFNRELREYFCSFVLMSFLKPRITRMWQNKFDNSKIRDYNHDNHEETRSWGDS